MLRRRSREDGDQQGPDEESQAREHRGNQFGDAEASGPWDVADDYPRAERIDCGSLLIPVRDGFDVQINVAEDDGAWVAVVHDESGMQLQAFAAPRSAGLWDDVRHEIAANIADTGGNCQEAYGPFGSELRADVPVREDDQPSQLNPVAFLGVDGPRWFLRGVISGPAATDRRLRTPFDEVFADVVVVRGDYPAPQRQQLEIRLPDEVRQAIDDQMAAEDNGWGLTDPFARGPEITETR